MKSHQIHVIEFIITYFEHRSKYPNYLKSHQIIKFIIEFSPYWNRGKNVSRLYFIYHYFENKNLSYFNTHFAQNKITKYWKETLSRDPPEGRWKNVLMMEAPLCEFNIAGI